MKFVPTFGLLSTLMAKRTPSMSFTLSPFVLARLTPHLRSYLTYKWAKNGEELAFDIPKAGSWNFKAFPDRGYDFSTSYSTTVKGTDKLGLKLDQARNKAIVEYEVTTVDPAMDNVWIGIFVYVHRVRCFV